MDEDAVIQFSAITSATPEQAERYLQLTDGNLEQAIQLYFEDPSLGSVQPPTTTTASPPQQAPTRPPEPGDRNAGREIIEIDSDDDSDVQMLDEVPRRPDTADDAEMARRLQEEMYGGARPEEEEIRAPMARTRETLIGGPTYDDMDDGEISALVQQQILGRQRRTNGRKCSH
jgi:UBX domain-containing protein 7